MGKTKELSIGEYLRFIGYSNPKYNKMNKEEKEIVHQKLLMRLRYLFYKNIEEEMEIVLNNKS